jgi:hypothetical protein
LENFFHDLDSSSSNPAFAQNDEAVFEYNGLSQRIHAGDDDVARLPITGATTLLQSNIRKRLHSLAGRFDTGIKYFHYRNSE